MFVKDKGKFSLVHSEAGRKVKSRREPSKVIRSSKGISFANRSDGGSRRIKLQMQLTDVILKCNISLTRKIIGVRRGTTSEAFHNG